MRIEKPAESVFFKSRYCDALLGYFAFTQSVCMKKRIASPAGMRHNQNTAVIGGIELRLTGGAIMELRVPGYFLAVAREDNFTRAVEQKASAIRTSPCEF